MSIEFDSATKQLFRVIDGHREEIKNLHVGIS
jgi:hypothetical protein